MLPTHLIPVVLITRCFCSVIASAPPLHSALTTAWMSCWCTTSWSAVTSPFSTARSISSLGASLSTTVIGRAVHLLEPGGAAQRVDLALQVADLRVVDVLPERVDVAGERADLLLQVVGALPLLAHDGVEVGHAGGTEVEPAGGEAAGHEQGSGDHEDHDGDERHQFTAPAGQLGIQRASRWGRSRCRWVLNGAPALGMDVA